MGRSPCCDKSNVKRGPWSPDEDWILKKYVGRNGTGGNWIALPQKAGLKRCGKSCRLRWLNYLRPGIKHGGFTEEEDNIISIIYQTLGSRWSVIASHLPGRTDNDIKNYWNTKLKKRKTSLPNQTNNNTTPTTGIPILKPGTHAHNNNGGFLMDQFKPIPVQPLAELPNRDVSAVSATSSSSISVDNVFSQVTWLESGGGGASDDLFSMNMGFEASSDLLDWYGFGEHFIYGEEDMIRSAMQGYNTIV